MKTLTQLTVIAMILGIQFSMDGGDATDCLLGDDREQHGLVRRSSGEDDDLDIGTRVLIAFISSTTCVCIGFVIRCCIRCHRNEEIIVVQNNNAQSQAQANQNQTFIINTPLPNYQVPLQPMDPGYPPQMTPQVVPQPAQYPANQPASQPFPQLAATTAPQPASQPFPQPAELPPPRYKP